MAKSTKKSDTVTETPAKSPELGVGTLEKPGRVEDLENRVKALETQFQALFKAAKSRWGELQ